MYFLLRLRNSENTDDDFELLRTKCSYYTIGHNEWIEKGFEDDDIISIYTTNTEVLAHNNRKVAQVGNPTALVESEYIEKGTSFSDNTFNSLALSIYICEGVKVVLTKNYL